jgi:NTE family protein
MIEQRIAPPRTIALALQGGGSHGAFTWGVLDRMLDDPAIKIIGATGTSAGAMNAAVLVDGLLRGGPVQGRAGLRRYWEAVGAMPGLGNLFCNVSGEAAAMTPLESIPAYVEMMNKRVSPYDLHPAANPLRSVLLEMINFDRLRSQEEIQLVVCATNVRTARRRIFTNKDISVDALLASACLPQFFPAVEIDGEPHWDGGWTGNPALAPLVLKVPGCDLIIVRIDPVNREETPRSLREIFERTTEISFNSAFWLELAAGAAVLRLGQHGLLDQQPLAHTRYHIMEASPLMERFPMSSKSNNYPPMLEYLHDLGWQTADAWMKQNENAIGQRSTLDLQQLLPVSVWGNI